MPFCTVMDMLVGVSGSWPIVPDAAFKPATPPVWVVPLTFTVTLLGVTVPTVKMRLKRGRDALRNTWEESL